MADTSLLSVESEQSPNRERVLWTTEDIKRVIESHTIVVFSKGKVGAARCGFSEQILAELDLCGKPYELIDITEDRSIAPALRAYAGLQYLPLVFVNSELVSTVQNQEELLSTGALKSQIEKAFV